MGGIEMRKFMNKINSLCNKTNFDKNQDIISLVQKMFTNMLCFCFENRFTFC
jgi:hypothetical protein